MIAHWQDSLSTALKAGSGHANWSCERWRAGHCPLQAESTASRAAPGEQVCGGPGATLEICMVSCWSYGLVGQGLHYLRHICADLFSLIMSDSLELVSAHQIFIINTGNSSLLILPVNLLRASDFPWKHSTPITASPHLS